jgi:type IV secretory pathway VirB10-like protein
MNLLVDLRVNEETVADSRVVNLEWTAPVKKGSPLVEMQPAQPQQPAPLALVTPQVQPPAPVAAPTPAPVATQRVRQLDRDEIATIVKRGEELLTEGDLASARLLLQRAAEARDARAALLLGSSYDPTTFGRLGVLGFEPDLAKAKAWYKRAAEMGSPDAPARLDRLAAQENAR